MADLEELYREIILDHYRSPRNRGELTDEAALRAEGFNPLCGDEILVTLHVEGDVVSDIKISGQGVVKFPMRIKCATLGWNTLAQALDDASL